MCADIVTVLIPAHNEEKSLPATLVSLTQQSTPPDRIVVVADNCTDRTVEVAKAHGVDVFETVGNTHKKGGALNQALKDLLPTLGDNDTVMVMDADSQIGDDSMDSWIWFPFWLGVGLLFAVERMITAWKGGWRARLVAVLIFPELVYDCFLNLAFLRGVFEIAFGRSATWKHVEHGSAPAAAPGADAAQRGGAS